MTPFTVTAALAAGGCVAWLYFSALRKTVEQLSHRRRPRLWLAASFLARAVFVLIGFVGLGYWGGASALVAGLLGFIVVRGVMLRRSHLTRPDAVRPS